MGKTPEISAGNGATGSGVAPQFAGRFNQFQRTMLQWSGLHPYHAVHVLKVEQPLAGGRYEERLNLVIEQCGLAALSLDEGGGSYRYDGGYPGLRIREVAGQGDPMAALDREIMWQLNEPIVRDGAFTPFRFFLMNTGGASYLGITYFHAVADAEAISRLLFTIARASFAPELPPLADESLRPGRISPMPAGNPLYFLPRARAALNRFRVMRKSIRPPSCEENEFSSAYFGVRFDEEQTRSVIARAKGWGLTVNDLCLAALLKAISTRAREVHWYKTYRPLLSVGCVVNVRRDLPEKRRRDFGLFLGSFAVTQDVSGEVTMHELARTVSERTLAVKRHKLYLAAPLEFMVSRFMFGRMPLEKQRNFYRKTYPLWGGITNMNMGTLQSDENDPPMVDYYRAVSVGPAMPMVIGVTGVEGVLNLGISYRPTVLSEGDVRGIVARFTALLTGSEEAA
jgi:NRPS condensation-like uncharacterized protein